MKNQTDQIGYKLHPFQKEIISKIRKGRMILSIPRGAGKETIRKHLITCTGCIECSGGDENLQEFNDPLKGE